MVSKMIMFLISVFVHGQRCIFCEFYSVFAVFIGVFLWHLQHFINKWSPYSSINVMVFNYAIKLVNTGTGIYHSTLALNIQEY